VAFTSAPEPNRGPLPDRLPPDGSERLPLSAPERLLQKLDWQVIRRLDGLLQGDYRSLFAGTGLDFAALREYEPGDDVRAIDWNVTARLDEPWIRVFHEDRELSAWFLLDLSPSVDFGTVTAGREKRTVLIEFVATLARLLTRRGNRVGAIVSGGAGEHLIPAGSGRNQVLRLLEDLLDQPRLASAPVTDLRPLLDAAHRRIRRRSLVILVSDFIGVPGWDRSLALLNRRHELMAIRVVDPREIELPDVGPIVIEDAETGEQLYVDTADRRFRERFRDAADAREAAVAAAFRGAHVDAATLSTEDDLVRAIVRMAAERRARRRIVR
jgi:uncharacterized protein (DUF58 family)